MGGSALKTVKTRKRRYEEENLTWGDNPKVVIVLLGESRNRSQCYSRSEMMSLAEHNILFALSRRRVTLRARCDSQRLADAQGKVAESAWRECQKRQPEGENPALVQNPKSDHLCSLECRWTTLSAPLTQK